MLPCPLSRARCLQNEPGPSGDAPSTTTRPREGSRSLRSPLQGSFPAPPEFPSGPFAHPIAHQAAAAASTAPGLRLPSLNHQKITSTKTGVRWQAGTAGYGLTTVTGTLKTTICPCFFPAATQ